MSVENIWENIEPDKDGKYYHPDDKEYLDTFKKYNKNNDYEIYLTQIPEPRLGDIDSKIFILSGNPSAESEVTKNKNTDEIQQKRLNSLKKQNSNHSGLGDGDRKENWWRDRFKEWVVIIENEANIDESNAYTSLSKNICSVEFFPYSSKYYGHSKLRLPSQQYQKAIVKNAMKNEANIVVTRNYYDWIGLIPELYNYEKTYYLSSSRGSYFTSKNLLNKSEFTEKLKKQKHVDDIRDKRETDYNPIVEILKDTRVIN